MDRKLNSNNLLAVLWQLACADKRFSIAIDED